MCSLKIKLLLCLLFSVFSVNGDSGNTSNETITRIDTGEIPALLPPPHSLPKLSVEEVLYTDWPARFIPQRRQVTAEEFGNQWPFTVTSGTFQCVTIPLIPSSAVFEMETGMPQSDLFPTPKNLSPEEAEAYTTSASFSGEILTFETHDEIYYGFDVLSAECADWGVWLNCPPLYAGPILNHAYKGLCQFSCTQAKQSIEANLRSEVKNANFFDKYKKLESVRNTGFNLCRK